mmetsp:Transcript_20915/g.23654  ORF Transcript_20915/g.23654 Transcript_20915/m.23654 type:complete len:529 (+) Transcript_20915:2-1588(+)
MSHSTINPGHSSVLFKGEQPIVCLAPDYTNGKVWYSANTSSIDCLSINKEFVDASFPRSESLVKKDQEGASGEESKRCDNAKQENREVFHGSHRLIRVDRAEDTTNLAKTSIVIQGKAHIIDHLTLINKKEIVLKYSNGDVALFDVLNGKIINKWEDTDFETKCQELQQEGSATMSWFTTDIRLGILSLNLEFAACTNPKNSSQLPAAFLSRIYYWWLLSRRREDGSDPPERTFKMECDPVVASYTPQKLALISRDYSSELHNKSLDYPPKWVTAIIYREYLEKMAEKIFFFVHSGDPDRIAEINLQKLSAKGDLRMVNLMRYIDDHLNVPKIIYEEYALRKSEAKSETNSVSTAATINSEEMSSEPRDNTKPEEDKTEDEESSKQEDEGKGDEKQQRSSNYNRNEEDDHDGDNERETHGYRQRKESSGESRKRNHKSLTLDYDPVEEVEIKCQGVTLDSEMCLSTIKYKVCKGDANPLQFIYRLKDLNELVERMTPQLEKYEKSLNRTLNLEGIRARGNRNQDEDDQ